MVQVDMSEGQHDHPHRHRDRPPKPRANMGSKGRVSVGGADAGHSSFEAPGVYEFSSRPLRVREAALEAAVLATEYIPKEQEEGMLQADSEESWSFDPEDTFGSPPRYDQHGNDLASPLAWAIDKSKRKIKVSDDLSKRL